MKDLSDGPARSRRATGRPSSGDQATVTAVGDDLVEWPAVEPAGQLVTGRYRLQSVLGRGGMGLVWLAEDELLERPVALKQVIPSEPVSEQSAKSARLRAVSEARAAARVHHDGAVRIHDVVKDEGRPWIVMEMLSGRTLAETINAAGPLPVDQVTRIGLCLLDVLQATHRAGIVHRDVKPGNVHLCEDGRVVLTDFGIAFTTDDDSEPPTDTFAGSPAYVSPERFHGAKPEPASDMFSLGATLFTAVEGRAPFDKGDLYATLMAVVEAAPGPFLRAGPLRPVIEGLLAKDPDLRLSIDQARAALQAVQREYPRRQQPRQGRMSTA
ncbi:MAG TPA: serine/threonine-protein kinase [Actinoplanes sp.]|jgi:serine/threonine protein kinase|nr:serine/threonine-protein kinase [Actinoplanes sp.]